MGERGEITTNQTERSQIQQDITKPLIPERQSTSNQSEPLQSQRDLTKPLIPKNQTEANVDLTKDTEKNVKPIVKNIQPEANAGKNQIAPEGSQVILDGSKSKDRDGKIESYRWQQILGPRGIKVALDNPNNIEANFISPQVSHDTILVFKLTVIDYKGSSDSAYYCGEGSREMKKYRQSPHPTFQIHLLQIFRICSNRIEGVGTRIYRTNQTLVIASECPRLGIQPS